MYADVMSHFICPRHSRWLQRICHNPLQLKLYPP